MKYFSKKRNSAKAGIIPLIGDCFFAKNATSWCRRLLAMNNKQTGLPEYGSPVCYLCEIELMD